MSDDVEVHQHFAVLEPVIFGKRQFRAPFRVNLEMFKYLYILRLTFASGVLVLNFSLSLQRRGMLYFREVAGKNVGGYVSLRYVSFFKDINARAS